MTTGLFDTRCHQCRRRIAWAGKITDRPACVRCGHRPDPSALQRDQEQISQWHTLMTMHPRRASAGDLLKMRELAGLNAAQASLILKLSRQELLDIESGLTPVCDEIAERMSRAYGCGRQRKSLTK